MRSYATAATVLGLASMTCAQSTIASTCATTDVCYGLNVPGTTASTGSGDIYFQISAPTTYQWVALGQGTGMAGANMFVMYTSADGTNVTVSPRLGKGEVEPLHDTSAMIELLAGSGVSNGKMTANVRCKNCNSWSGGSMDFKAASNTDWIYAYKKGSPLNSDDLSADITRHDAAEEFTFNLATASGGEDANPFITSSSSAAGSIPSNNTATATNTTKPASSISQKKKNDILLAHGALASIAFVALLPAGGILIRLASFTGLIWVHAALQLLGYVVYIAAFGLGVWFANQYDYLGETHPRLGIAVFALLAFQPVLGLLHHLLFKKHGRRTWMAHVHANLGRIVILLGIVNGGLGLKLVGAEKKDKIAYGVCAGVMGVAYLAAIVFGEMKMVKQKSAIRRRLNSDQSMGEVKSHGNEHST